MLVVAGITSVSIVAAGKADLRAIVISDGKHNIRTPNSACAIDAATGNLGDSMVIDSAHGVIVAATNVRATEA